MGKKGSGGSQTTTQTAEPWVGVQGPLMNLYANTQQVMGQPMTPGANDFMNNAAWWAMQRANQPNNLLNGANNTASYFQSGQYTGGNPVMTGQMLKDDTWAQGQEAQNNPTALGAYLSEGNPYLKGMSDAATRQITDQFQNSIAPALASQFSAAGRMGSGSHVAAFDSAASTLGRQLGDTNANIYGTAYENERNRMQQAFEAERARQYGAYQMERGGQQQMWMNNPQIQLAAAGMAPAISNANLAPIQLLEQIGLDQRGVQSELMSDPMRRMQAAAGIYSGASPYASSTGSGSTQQPYNRLTGTIGGGLGGYALGSLMGLGPAGALLGGLGGLFG